jgi:hypothetical protein
MRLLALLAVGAALGVTGCSRMAIDGQVADVAGEPIAGAMVTAVGGAQCQSRTDETGTFELVCSPQHYEVHIGKTGYIPEVLEAFDASERKRYEIGVRTLIKIPSERGLTRFKGNEYVPMVRGWLEKTTASGPNGYRHYCLKDDDVPVNTLAPGLNPFFDYESEGWKVFKLDDEGCAYRMSPGKDGKAKWQVDYADRPKSETRELEHGKDIVIMDLPQGRYFIADWSKGFFTKGKLPDGKSGYLGYLVDTNR